MALPFLESRLRDALAAAGRPELSAAIDRIGLTNDGKSSIYVHLQTRPGWPKRRPGEAYLLCHVDYPDIHGLDTFRWLISESKLEIDQELPRIIRWLARE
ncbi:MAG TPA: hypothetical protein VFO84_10940 [Dehalococcoidia bacterium]|nr:hypothetical protein [Dehalococcoidia bacterium]